MFRRLLMAAAGYMAYRWWNKRSEEPTIRRTADSRVPAADGDTPRRN